MVLRMAGNVSSYIHTREKDEWGFVVVVVVVGDCLEHLFNLVINHYQIPSFLSLLVINCTFFSNLIYSLLPAVY